MLRAVYAEAFTASLHPVFVTAACVGAVGFLLTWFLQDVPLRGPARADTIGESFAMPRDATSLQELEQIVGRLQRRENRWQVYQTIADRPASRSRPMKSGCWPGFCRADRTSSGEPALDLERFAGIGQKLAAKDMAVRCTDGALVVSSRGRDTFERMVAVRRARLAQLLERWKPEEHAEVARCSTVSRRP